MTDQELLKLKQSLIDPDNDFDRVVACVLEVEGGHSNRSPEDDPGGETWYGLTRRWNPELPWPPSLKQAKEQYRQKYWLTIQGPYLPWPLSLVVFDAAVQHAPKDAIRFLQVVLGAEADGVFGPQTFLALKAKVYGRHSAPIHALQLAGEIIARRMVYYPTLPNWGSNALGWSRRLVSIYKEACRDE